MVAKATIKDAIALAAIFDIYCYVSSQAVNYGKSTIIFSPHTPSTNRQQMTALFHILEKRSNWQYLGMPLSRQYSHVNDYTALVEKVTNRIKT